MISQLQWVAALWLLGKKKKKKKNLIKFNLWGGKFKKTHGSRNKTKAEKENVTIIIIITTTLYQGITNDTEFGTNPSMAGNHHNNNQCRDILLINIHTKSPS